jgi:hypothetical protein
MFSLQKLPVTDTFEAVARLELPQISDSIIYEIIPELKRFPLQSRAAELPRFYRGADTGVGMTVPPPSRLRVAL